MTDGPVLLHARNRRGLGHLVRVQNLARAVLDRDPDRTVNVHATHAPDPALAEPGVTITHGPEPSWDRLRATLRPSVVVHDTKPAHPFDTDLAGGPSADVARGATRTVFVMRRRRPDQHEALLATPGLDRVDAVIIPHTADEFDLPLPASLRDRCHLVGPIARRPAADARPRARRRHGIADDAFLLTITVGGGGFADQADRFFELAGAIVPAVASARPDARIVVVLGPNYDNASTATQLRELPVTTVVPVEPRLVDLLAASDLVIAEGGYNTVTEIRVTGVPAVFLPGARSLDDQVDRVERVASTGAAVVVDPSRPARAAAATVAGLAAEADRLAAMRRAAASHPPRLGNDAAAAVILGLAVGPGSAAPGGER